MRVLGIDLGTTNTVAAIENVALPISTDDGRTTLPSVVSFAPNGRIQCGLSAKRRRSIDPRNTIFSSKRIIGRGWSDSTTRDFQKRYPFDLVKVGNGLAGFSTRAGIFTPVDVAAIILTSSGLVIHNVHQDRRGVRGREHDLTGLADDQLQLSDGGGVSLRGHDVLATSRR